MANQRITNFDTTKVFLRDNRFVEVTYTNPSGAAVAELKKGDVFGRVASTEKVLPLDKDATTGEQYPLGVLVEDLDVAASGTVTLTLCVSGDVEETELNFPAGTDLTTVIEAKTVRDRMMSDTMGIFLVASEELTEYDNQ